MFSSKGKGLLLWMAVGMIPLCAAERPLQIYLPQEIRLEGQTVELGQIAILLGDDALIEKARSVSLGSFAMDGQTLRVDRNTILSRLAGDGIRPAQVHIRGAEIVHIGRQEMTVSAEQIVACARRCLERNLSGHQGTEAELIRSPKPQVLSIEHGAAELTATDAVPQGDGTWRIRVAVLQDGRAVAEEDVFFTVRYQIRQVIAAEDLPAGTVLTSENVRVETVLSDRPESTDWVVPYGMATTCRVAKGTVVAESVLEPQRGPVVVQRRQVVMVQIDNGILFVSAHGEAMEEGRVGQTIRVRRGQRPNDRIIICRVQADGTVEPVL